MFTIGYKNPQDFQSERDRQFRAVVLSHQSTSNFYVLFFLHSPTKNCNTIQAKLPMEAQLRVNFARLCEKLYFLIWNSHGFCQNCESDCLSFDNRSSSDKFANSCSLSIATTPLGVLDFMPVFWSIVQARWQRDSRCFKNWSHTSKHRNMNWVLSSNLFDGSHCTTNTATRRRERSTTIADLIRNKEGQVEPRLFLRIVGLFDYSVSRICTIVATCPLVTKQNAKRQSVRRRLPLIWVEAFDYCVLC